MLSSVAEGLEEVINLWRDRLLQQPPEAMKEKPGPDRWAIIEVFGHLIDSANNNHQRFVRAQQCEELKFPKYEQNEWVQAADYLNSEWKTIVELWYFYNRQLATVIRNIDEGSLEKSCAITPYEPCTLSFLVTDYLDHLKHHLDILDQRLSELESQR